MIPQTTLRMVVQAVDNASAQLNRISGSVEAVGTRVRGATGAVAGLAQSFAAIAAATGAAAVFGAFVRNTSEAQEASNKLEQAVRRLGEGAGVTTAQIKVLATEIQNTSRFTDESVQTAASSLLLFDKIVGKTFTEALRVSADLAVVLGTDVPQAATSLGRALQLPGEGLRVLIQAGIKFNDEQVKTLQYMTETGRVAEAQAFILAEVKKRTDGAAAATRDNLGGALAALKNRLGELLEFTGVFDSLAAGVNRLADSFGRLTLAKADGIAQDLAILEVQRRSKYNDDDTNRRLDERIAKTKNLLFIAKNDGAPARGLIAGRGGFTEKSGATAADPLAAETAARVAAEKAADAREKAQAAAIAKQEEHTRAVERWRAAMEEAGDVSMGVFADQQKDLRKLLDAQDALTATYAEREVAAFEDKMAAIQALRAAGVKSEAVLLAREAEIVQEFNDTVLAEVKVTAQRMAEAYVSPVKQFTDNIKDAFESMVRTGKFSMKSLINNLIAELLQKRLYDAIDKMGDALETALSGKSGKGNGFIAGAAKFLGSFFGYAGGGKASRTFVTGEDGPELVTSGINSLRVFNARQLAFNGAGGAGGSVAAMTYAPVYNISGVETQAVVAYVERSKQEDQRGLLRMLERNGFGRMK